MKAYIKNTNYTFYYPEDMKKILDYLNKNGKLNVSDKTVENLYCDFSDRYAAGWLCVNEELLEEFADYIAEVEL